VITNQHFDCQNMHGIYIEYDEQHLLDICVPTEPGRLLIEGGFAAPLCLGGALSHVTSPATPKKCIDGRTEFGRRIADFVYGAITT